MANEKTRPKRPTKPSTNEYGVKDYERQRHELKDIGNTTHPLLGMWQMERDRERAGTFGRRELEFMKLTQETEVRRLDHMLSRSETQDKITLNLMDRIKTLESIVETLVTILEDKE